MTMQIFRNDNHLRKGISKNGIGLLLIVLGISMLLFPVLSYVQSVQAQQGLEEQWERAIVSTEPQTQSTGGQPETSMPADPKLRKPAHSVSREFPPTRLIIPKIDLNAMVVDGTTLAALKRGPGHFTGTALPGESGNCCIAAHRNMYGWWFYKLDKLKPGDDIILSTPNGDYLYKVRECFTVLPEDVRVLDPKPGCTLTLVTCTPVPRPTHRLIIVAELEDSRKSDSNSN